MHRRLSAGGPKEALVRIFGPSGRVMGTGCYALNGLVVTCAHVVRDALKLDPYQLTGAVPRGRIKLDFPFLPNKPRKNQSQATLVTLEAEVAPSGWGWLQGVSHDRDIAILRLLDDAPFDHGRLFAKEDRLQENIVVFAHGFPSGYPDGWKVDGILQAYGNQPNGLRVLDYNACPYLFHPGFSGAPVFFDHGAEAVGLFLGTQEFDKNIERQPNAIAYVIPGSYVMAQLDAVVRSDSVAGISEILARAEAYAALLQERVELVRVNDTRLCDGLQLTLGSISQTIQLGIDAQALDGFARTVGHLQRFRADPAINALESRLSILQLAEVKAALTALCLKYTPSSRADLAGSSVINDLTAETLPHGAEREVLLRAVEDRLRSLTDSRLNIPDRLRTKAKAVLVDIQIELYHNPLSLAVLNEARAELEALDQSLFDALIIQCQTLLGVYAEKLPLGAIFRDFCKGPEMVVIPAGCFWMGSREDEPKRSDMEGPRHEVTLKRFAMGRYAVTFDDWLFAVTEGGCNGYEPEDLDWGRRDRPVINVSWDDAKAYIRWLCEKTNKVYRLPSEAEWEYAARATTDGPFSFEGKITTNKANYDGNYSYEGSSKGEYHQQTLPVRSFEPNMFGLYQIHGNVWEWCEDNWHYSYADKPDALKVNGGAWTAEDSNVHVLRGGSWDLPPSWLRSANRYWGLGC